MEDERLPRTADDARERAKASVRLIAWCRDRRRRVEPDPAALAARYGTETAVLDWHARLVCSVCGGRHVDFVVSGTERSLDVWPVGLAR